MIITILHPKYDHRGVVVMTTAQLHSAKAQRKFCANSNPARGVSEIYDGEMLFCLSTIP